MSALLERRVTAGAPPASYKPPTPRPTRLVLEIGHQSFLLPAGLNVQEAAALAYMLGQSVQTTQHYDPATGAYKTVVARPCDYSPVSLSIVDPKDVSFPEDAPTTATESVE